MCDIKQVYPITKVPLGYSNNAYELLKYYREQKKLTSDMTSWKCYCCQKDKSNMVATFVVGTHHINKSIYLTSICLDCLKEHIENPDNPSLFGALREDLLYISKYDSSAEFKDISIKEP